MAFDTFQRELKKIAREKQFPVDFRVAPIAELLSSTVEALDIEIGDARISFDADERFLHGGGVLQGGILGSMLDLAMASLILADLDDGQSIATTNLNIEFLSPALAGRYTATAKVIRKGRKVSFTRADLHDAKGKHVASASATNILIVIPDSK